MIWAAALLTYPFCACKQGVFEVLATGGDTALGGDDYDRALAMLAAKKMGITEFSDEDFWRLTTAAESPKKR